MELKAAEISEIIKQQIQGYDKQVEVRETGTVLSAGDGIARVHGLDRVASGELLLFPHDIYGIALNLEEDNVGAADLSVKSKPSKKGTKFAVRVASLRCQSEMRCWAG